MKPSMPCVRHGHASTSDPRLLEMLAHAEKLGFVLSDNKLLALLDYDDQIWVTWRDEAARAAGSELISRAWEMAGGKAGAMHLVRSTQDYDYQEDCMNVT